MDSRNVSKILDPMGTSKQKQGQTNVHPDGGPFLLLSFFVFSKSAVMCLASFEFAGTTEMLSVFAQSISSILSDVKQLKTMIAESRISSGLSFFNFSISTSARIPNPFFFVT